MPLETSHRRINSTCRTSGQRQSSRSSPTLCQAGHHSILHPRRLPPIVPSPLNSNVWMNSASSDTRLYPVITSFFSSLMPQIKGLMTEINGVVPAAWSDSPPQPTIEPGHGQLSSRMMSRDGRPIPWELLDWFCNEISHGTPALEGGGGSSAIVP